MERNYALLPDRVKAVIIDSIVIIAMMYGVSELFALFETVPDIFRIIAAVFIGLLYDPIFTSIYGGTIGHSYSNITVKRANDPNKNITFPFALLRFILKTFLGWISLLTVTSNKQKRAIHDLVANSIVLEEQKKKD